MKRVEMDVIGDDVNAAVVQLPWRRFPGLVVQGDSLSILAAHATELAAALAEGRIDDAAERASELRALLDGYQAAYERAMTTAGLTLPYSPRIRP
jgi:hypothetical protein